MGASRVSRIEIEGHRGMFDIGLDLFPDVTVVHGENGTQKTTALHYLANSIALDHEALSRGEFDRIALTLESGMELAISSRPPSADSVDRRSAIVVYLNDVEVVSIAPEDDPRSYLQQVREVFSATGLANPTYLPAFRTLLEAADSDRSQRERAYFDEIAGLGNDAGAPLDRILLYESRKRRPDRVNAPTPAVARARLGPLRATIEKTLFARLFFGDFVPLVGYPTIGEVERQLHSMMFGATRMISTEESTFFSEAVRAVTASSFHSTVHLADQVDSVLRQLAELKGRFEAVALVSGRLQAMAKTAATLMDRIDNSDGEDLERALTIAFSFMDGMNTLAANAEEALAPAERLESAVNGFLSSKRFRLIRRRARPGMVELEDGTTVAIDQLSSGERQVIAMLVCAESITTPMNALIIDEPEISLHVDWQRSILPALRGLASDAQIVVATHSPEVAASAPDHLVELSIRKRRLSEICDEGPSGSDEGYLPDEVEDD